MFAWMKNMSHITSRFDSAFERFMSQHRVLGFLVVFVGLPLITLTAVCVGTTAIVLPFALAFGWTL